MHSSVVVGLLVAINVQVFGPVSASAPADTAPQTTRLAYILKLLFVYLCEGTK